jgi:hypothetical protein
MMKINVKKDKAIKALLAEEKEIMIDEVLPRQCPCSRAFDLESALWDLANSTTIRQKQGNTRFYPGSPPLVG